MNKIIENPLISVYYLFITIKIYKNQLIVSFHKAIKYWVTSYDDCSDNTQIINDIKDIRVRIFRNKNNQGLTKSLNTLIKESKGQILARQDSDDISLPNRLEIQYNELQKFQLDACTTRAYIKDSKRSIPRFSHLLPIGIVKKYKNPFIHGTLMVRKNAILNVGMYDENMKYAQDYKLFLELLKRNYKIKILNKKLYVLNMKNNISSLKKEEQQSFLEKFNRIIYED